MLPNLPRHVLDVAVIRAVEQFDAEREGLLWQVFRCHVIIIG